MIKFCVFGTPNFLVDENLDEFDDYDSDESDVYEENLISLTDLPNYSGRCFMLYASNHFLR